MSALIDDVPLPPGHTVRPPTLDDVKDAFDIMVAYDVSRIGRADVALDDVRADFEHRTVDLVNGCWLVEDADGHAVAVGITYWDAEHDELMFDPYVHPDASADLWGWLVGRSLARAEALRQETGRDVLLDGGAYAEDDEWQGWLERSGLGRVRRFWTMRIELGADRQPPTLPDDVEIRRVDVDDEADLRRMHHVMDESFSTHFGSHRRDYETWLGDAKGGSGYDPTQWWLALVDGEPAAGLMGSDRMADEGFGYVRGLGTLEAYRGRGLAKALLLTAFADYQARGWKGAELGVDSSNPTGATRLYESVGMSVDRTIDIWRGTLTETGVVASKPDS